jgi:glutamate synthase domain-containing protein 3
VDLERFEDPEDATLVHDLLRQHREYTGSSVAARLLDDWDATKAKFVKVMPKDYRRVLEEQKALTNGHKDEVPVVSGGNGHGTVPLPVADEDEVVEAH